MKKYKIVITLVILILLLFSLSYAFARDRLRVRVYAPYFAKPVERFPLQVSENLRKSIAERNKVWFELRELLLEKPLDLKKIEEKANELQKLEEDISTKIQANLLENLSKKLSLSKDQENSIKKILESYKDKLESLRKDLRKKTIELRTIDSKDKEKINAVKKEIENIQKKIDEARKNLIDEVEKVLTKEQKEKFDKYFKGVYTYKFKVYIPRGRLWIKR